MIYMSIKLYTRFAPFRLSALFRKLFKVIFVQINHTNKKTSSLDQGCYCSFTVSTKECYVFHPTKFEITIPN